MRRLGMSLGLLGAVLLPSSVQAQVVFDPDSPAGKEYAIPLEEKRDAASGGGGGTAGDGQAETFGEGISNPAEKNGKGSDGKSSESKKGDDDESEAATAGSGSDDGGGGGSGGGTQQAGADGALLTSGIALAVLLLGGGIAFLMRRGAFGTDA